MKRLTYLLGFLSSISICLGMLFGILHWSGAQQLTFAGYIGFLFLFIPMLAILRHKDLSSPDRIVRFKYGIGMFAGLLTGIALLFKLLHLAGADRLLIAGFFVFIAGFLPLLFYSLYRKSVS